MYTSWHTDRYLGSLFRVDEPVPVILQYIGKDYLVSSSPSYFFMPARPGGGGAGRVRERRHPVSG